ncbi:mRNA cap guanine-N7 methyltransferase [Chionoecetes opilio]|uniref:mRNA (guanine-N(7))-methyltransferase n=1 Tax=Chionoecetes opilio TaxID=41210 RepID=A0A8J5CP70_CHIOP|nr:mRNA cap guanine-N7 methyltransferase [Chionoecetes opilio]
MLVKSWPVEIFHRCTSTGDIYKNCPDWSRVKAGDGMKCGNEVYRISFPADRPEKPPLFGDCYNFFLEGVVDCPEFLVHPPTLQKLAKKWGLEMVWCRNFSTVFQDALREQDSQRLLSVMQALEQYPSRDEPATASEGEYSHAEDHLKAKEGVDAIRTLSKSEWEALCIYQAWVFKKVT